MKVWLIGAGSIAPDYVAVLRALNTDFSVIGRGEQSAKNLELKIHMPVARGGLSAVRRFISDTDRVIIAVGVDQLARVTLDAIDCGVRQILVEKPAGMHLDEIEQVAEKARLTGASVYVAYNRRFYGSTIIAQRLIKEDGGVSSFTFEFTEWGHEIEGLRKAPGVKENWLLANSSHVIDLAFHIGGRPIEIHTMNSGSLLWHPAGSIFTGAGRTGDGALFSYHANWGSAGRWGLEFNTSKRRLIFRPMEILQEMLKGSVGIHEIGCDDDLDKRFKPGFFRQLRAFLQGVDADRLCRLDEHVQRVAWYARIGGYIK